MFFNYTSILKLIATYKIARKKYAERKNIQLFLKNKLKKTDVIKISYDTQSGDYIKYFNKLPKKKIEKIYYPLIKAINNNFKYSKTILDFGCGELTTSYYVFNHLKKKIVKYLANDNSLNRLIIGKNNLRKYLNKNDFKKFEIFCNSEYKLPFKENSIDLVFTIHSLEPNNKIKEKIFDELYRISRHGIIFMEPHYEIASKKQKKRMVNLDYVRGFERLLKNKKINYQIIKKKYHINNENISSLFIIKKKKTNKKNNHRFVDPLDLTELKDFKKYFYSKNNFRIFPIIDDVKIFNNDTQLFLPSIKKSR